ncbi:MAG TPA: hypothetical protein VHD38_00435 [Candidatus Paceibacterota bacterium]|nr:hypothetical protein [Candidatus Paceibacterota bacterium]
MNDMHKDIRETIMERIREGKASMRPRWHFILLSTLTALGIIIALLALLFCVSLVLFFLRESGALYLSGFGSRGWWDLFRSLPFSILILLLVFVIVLEILARRYAFVYKKPLITSVLAILAVVIVGGFVLAQTPLHGQLVVLARHGHLPPPFDSLYRPPFTMHPDDVYPGEIVIITDVGIVISDRGLSTTTILITPRTRLPEGANFAVGDRVVVIGDEAASGTVEAFGIRPMQPEPPDMMK